MDIGKTGSTLFRMYSGAVVLMWGIGLLGGGAMLLYMGFEPFRTRACVMVAVGSVILCLSVLNMTGGLKKRERVADETQREYDADEAIRRYLKQKAEAPPAAAPPPAVTEAPAPAPTAALPQRPVFGRRAV
jgi:hypothetical protein